MAADEYLRFVNEQLLFCFGIVFRRITTNMPHHYLHFLAHKNQLLGKFCPDISPINIAINSLETLFLPDALSYLLCSKIPRMPHFIAVFEVLKYRLIKVIMRIRYEPYSCQIVSI